MRDTVTKSESDRSDHSVVNRWNYREQLGSKGYSSLDVCLQSISTALHHGFECQWICVSKQDRVCGLDELGLNLKSSANNKYCWGTEYYFCFETLFSDIN